MKRSRGVTAMAILFILSGGSGVAGAVKCKVRVTVTGSYAQNDRLASLARHVLNYRPSENGLD